MRHRYERDNSLNTAAAIVRARVEADPRYRSMHEALVERIVARYLACAGVEAFRAAGGRTAVATAELAAILAERAHEASVNLGSELFPLTIGNALRGNATAIQKVAYLREMNARAKSA